MQIILQGIVTSW